MKQLFKRMVHWGSTALLAGAIWAGSNAAAPSQAHAVEPTVVWWAYTVVIDGVEYLAFIGLAPGVNPNTIAAAELMSMNMAIDTAPIALGPVAGPPAGAAGGGALATGGIIVGAVLVAVASTIAIDYAMNGNFFWEPVNDAGGWGVVLGTAPNPAAAPNPGWVTVNCNPAAGDLTTQCQAALANVITGYYSWFGGSYWTCGEMWASSGSSDLWNQEMANCNAQVQGCIAQTQQVCMANNLQPPPAVP
ncbi:MAG: hypothetical protein IPK82_34835 [Polyangiaceae bacterium]|nr:hypothetical protein [Polyangiaceae bacterium]